MKKINYFVLIIGVLTIITSIGLLVLGLTYGQNNVKKPDIYITKEIEVTSSKSSLGNYKTRITGVIKNNTNKDLIDNKLTFNVSTPWLNNKGELESPLFTINASSEYIINLYYDTNENFEEIDDVYICLSNGETLCLKNTSIFMNIEISMGIILFFAGFIIVIISLVPKIKENMKNQKKSTEEEIEDLNLNIQKNKLELQKQQAILENEKIESEIKKIRNEHLICNYCGSNNERNATKCKNCGASLFVGSDHIKK